ncbi:hypothetical protein LPJ63_003853 [Coemansia sp. RSA 2711]|nr:hypothetical protein LPJ63_003853 [Coemansia sp. RSA 2711]
MAARQVRPAENWCHESAYARCTQRLETEVSEIRDSDAWIQRIVQRCRHVQRQRSEDYQVAAKPSTVAPTDDGQKLQSTCVVEPSYDAQRADEDADSSQPTRNPDTMPLAGGFGSRGLREHLYPVNSHESTEQCESSPERPPTEHRFKLAMLLMVHAAMLVYLGALWRLLRPRISQPFAWHPVLMSVALVVTTEAVAIMQYVPWPTPKAYTRPARTFHYSALAVACVIQIAGVIQCVIGKSASVKDAPTGNTAHGVVGVLGMFMFGGQLAFGVYLAGVAPMMGRQKQAKLRYKYHRAFGYATLVVQWAGAWLGVHSRWLQSEGALSEWVWLLCFCMLVVGLLVPVDMGKFGFRQPLL